MLLHEGLFDGRRRDLGFLGGAKISSISSSKDFVKSMSTSAWNFFFCFLGLNADPLSEGEVFSETTEKVPN